MKKKIPTVIFILISIVFLFSFAIRQSLPTIPKVWDIQQLEYMHLPYADTSIKVGFVPSAYMIRSLKEFLIKPILSICRAENQPAIMIR